MHMCPDATRVWGVGGVAVSKLRVFFAGTRYFFHVSPYSSIVLCATHERPRNRKLSSLKTAMCNYEAVLGAPAYMG